MRTALMCCVFFGSVCAAAPAIAQQAPPDAAEIRSCVERNAPKSGRQAIRLETTDASGTSRKLEATAFWKPDDRGQARMLIRIDAPQDERGSAFLFHERDGGHDIWTYLPELRAVRRVTARGVSLPLFGSDFTYEDVVQLQAEARYAEIERLPDEELDGRPVRVLSAVPGSDSDSGYGRVVSYVDAATCVVLRAALHDRAGTLVKEMRVPWADVREQGGVWRPGVVTMRDLVRGSESRLAFERADWSAEVPEALFQPNELTKGR